MCGLWGVIPLRWMMIFGSAVKSWKRKMLKIKKIKMKKKTTIPTSAVFVVRNILAMAIILAQLKTQAVVVMVATTLLLQLEFGMRRKNLDIR